MHSFLTRLHQNHNLQVAFALNVQKVIYPYSRANYVYVDNIHVARLPQSKKKVRGIVHQIIQFMSFCQIAPVVTMRALLVFICCAMYVTRTRGFGSMSN